MTTALCTSCSRPARYRCPRCLASSCSLECVHHHKLASACSGISTPQFLEKRLLHSEAALNSDYRFLLNVERSIDNAARLKNSLLKQKPVFSLNPILRTLEWLVRIDNNESRFLSHSVSEKCTLADAFTSLKSSQPSPILDQLNNKNICFHLKSPSAQLPETCTLAAALKGKAIIGYPSIYIEKIEVECPSVEVQKTEVECPSDVEIKASKHQYLSDQLSTKRSPSNILPIYYSDESDESDQCNLPGTTG
ncbi:Box C/D snoRNA protein 1 [Neolecta irregularis DAH-3]|uniref:Box C/D snoRNA protein 1 n=1 Tax=Neolecta irregularis (strain DAH-3) TaxID=1198029 RepID=A0A1U7LWZ3_NEOID|nr:Box C/D snoRNA protein 1 [Neolecta irregularis DAH-3]|eukprot:OLL27093.1 Box C/D snoRNA protein 1 [Neolecta irregularis DAH-3]